MKSTPVWLAVSIVVLLSAFSTPEKASVTILSSNLADGNTVGEWGFSALVEVDGSCVLFDTGRFPETVIRNAETLGVDLSCVTDVVLSHFHSDHTGGLLTLMRKFRPDHPDSFRRVHVASGFFLSRRAPSSRGDSEVNGMIAVRDTLESAGIEVFEHNGPTEILPSIWMTGSIPRTHDEKNYPRMIKVNLDNELVEDYVPESQALSIVTPRGHIVIMGCGHAGVVNTLEYIQSELKDAPIHALMGGLHLFASSDETLGWTADRLRAIGVEHLMAGHCTGIEPLIRLRQGLNLTRKTAVVGSVGSRFVFGVGIEPGAIAM